ncbi:MAG: F0F1 ATP synthase subunit A [Bacteroidia bacterium]|nr:F0F1 ATP synthase subunit A [Bacteroidia bacterium]MCF8427223.1 F0F1 ATP synthase subunit A [Bacteroidia bacterium]MCF8446421.1 F0F1 ATP synthase subunit A [Bacteroidia bacterium]
MQSNNKKIFRYLIPVFLVLLYVGYNSASLFADESHTVDSLTETATVASHDAEHHETIGEMEHESAVEAEHKVDAGKLIMEHIGDAHDWHIATIGKSHISIPLPIIIKDNQGFKIFSSSRFHHGHEAYEGYKLEENKIVAVNEAGEINHEASFLDLSITKNVMSMFISVLFLCWLMLSVARHYTKNAGKAPKGIANLIETLIMFIRDEVAKPSIGPKYAKFLPYLLTIFFFIFINNLFGLIPFFPGGANVTGNIAVTMVLAVFTFVITSFNGNKSYWGHIFMPPGVPKALWILLVPIEIIGMLNKPIVLMIRLFANITAGHIIMLGFFSLIFIFGAMSETLGLGVSVLSVAFTVFMNFLELLVAFLQAYVFTLLSALYFGMAVEEHAHEEHH